MRSTLHIGAGYGRSVWCQCQICSQIGTSYRLKLTPPIGVTIDWAMIPVEKVIFDAGIEWQNEHLVISIGQFEAALDADA